MSRILLGGVGPLPSAKAKQVYATGLRLQTMADAIKARGHDVRLIQAAFDTENSETTNQKFLLSGNIEQDVRRIRKLISKAEDAGKPFDAVVTTTDYVGHVAAKAAGDLPLWCDFFGHPMAERQMQASVGRNNGGIEDQWRMILPILVRADRFSVCSNAQRLALIGELGATGRLGFENCYDDPVRILQPPNPFTERFKSADQPLLRGPVVPEKSKIILFTGGYNTWLDEETLFSGVEKALSQNPDLHYVSTGGEIKGHVTDVFQNFRRRVDASDHKERFHFIGWVEHDEFVQACLESDVGVMIDQPTLEGELGCRNRLYSWLWAGMRCVTSDLSEPTREQLVPHKWVSVVPMKDSDALAQALLREAGRGRLGNSGRYSRNRKMDEILSVEKCYGDLADWCDNPVQSADNLLPREDWNSLRKKQSVDAGSELENALTEFFLRVDGSRLFRGYTRLKPGIRELANRLRRSLRNR